MQVIGICRFSYPGIGGFQVDFPTLEERIAYLYSSARMAERFRTFEAITLPCLKAQTDGDFTLLIVIGEAMPAAYEARLRHLVADLPQAVIQIHPPGQHRVVMQAAIQSVRRPELGPSVQFRLDDDDGVALNFVSRLREAALDLRKLMRRHRRVVIDFDRGFIITPGPNGIAAKAVQEPAHTPGLALMLPPKAQLTVMNFSHVKMVRDLPTVSFSETTMFLRGHGEFNDSRQKPAADPVPLRLMNAEEEAALKDNFGVDADHVRTVWS